MLIMQQWEAVSKKKLKKKSLWKEKGGRLTEGPSYFAIPCHLYYTTEHSSWQLQKTQPHHLHLSERFKERGMTQ